MVREFTRFGMGGTEQIHYGIRFCDSESSTLYFSPVRDECVVPGPEDSPPGVVSQSCWTAPAILHRSAHYHQCPPLCTLFLCLCGTLHGPAPTHHCQNQGDIICWRKNSTNVVANVNHIFIQASNSAWGHSHCHRFKLQYCYWYQLISICVCCRWFEMRGSVKTTRQRWSQWWSWCQPTLFSGTRRYQWRHGQPILPLHTFSR